MYLVLVFIVTFMALLWGAHHIITGASGLAAHFNNATFIMGLTLIALLTTIPEIMLYSSTFLKIENTHFIGSIIGSNIANLSLVFGVSILLKPHSSNHLRSYLSLIILSMLFLYGLVLDGFLGQVDGFFFLIIGIGFIIFFIIYANQWHQKDPLFYKLKSAMSLNISLQRHLINMLIGTLVLPISMNYLLKNMELITQYFGLHNPPLVLTLIAIGTTIPTLITALLALFHGKEGLGLGIILGSNILTLMLIFVVPLPIVPVKISNAILWRQLPLILCLAMLLSLLIHQNKKSKKTGHGSLLILIYCCYITSIIITAHTG